MKTRLVLVLLTILSGLGVSACNTVEGLGQDVESLGDNIEDEAREQKSY